MSAKVLIIGKGCRTRELLKKALSENDEIKVVQCNSDLISRKKLIESFNASINTGYETFPPDIIIEAINNQPQVQPIVRNVEEVVEELETIYDGGTHDKQCCFDWLQSEAKEM